MSLVATSYPSGESGSPAAPVANNGFWPDLDPADFRTTQRLAADIAAERISHALRIAVGDINRQLRGFQADQIDAGVNKHTDIEPLPWQTPEQITACYRQAVYTSAHASLWERYADYSATAETSDRADERMSTADVLRRDARWAVAEILDLPHSRIELI